MYACAIVGSYCEVNEDLILPGYDAVSFGKNITNVKIKYRHLGKFIAEPSFGTEFGCYNISESSLSYCEVKGMV